MDNDMIWNLTKIKLLSVVYKRLLLTRNKKSYAGIITSELGRTLDKPILDMKGINMALLF